MKQLSSSPAIPSLYLRAALPKKADKKATSLPNVGLELKGVRAKEKHVRAYEKVCGFEQSNQLSSVYVHMLVFPLMMEVMLDKSFPYPLMGMVHISNTITQHKPIGISENMDIRCRLGELKAHNKGKVVELVSEVLVNGEVVWEESADMLVRLPVKGEKKAEASVEQLTNKKAEWKLGSTLGMRYAWVSGDSNPIHLTTPTAKLLGFKKHIAHGMWTKARCLAEMQSELSEAYTVKVDFKLPVFLPTSVSYYQEESKKETIFEVRSADGQKPHMRGQLIKL